MNWTSWSTGNRLSCTTFSTGQIWSTPNSLSSLLQIPWICLNVCSRTKYPVVSVNLIKQSNVSTSCLGLTRVNFQPYTFQQLATIIHSRLTDNPLFEEPAIQLCARKVSAVSGDARRALDLCRSLSSKTFTFWHISSRAVEIAEAKKLKTVSIAIIQEAIQEMLSTAGVIAVQSSALHQKIFVHAILEQFRYTGLNETTFADVCHNAKISYWNMPAYLLVCNSFVHAWVGGYQAHRILSVS